MTVVREEPDVSSLLPSKPLVV